MQINAKKTAKSSKRTPIKRGVSRAACGKVLAVTVRGKIIIVQLLCAITVKLCEESSVPMTHLQLINCCVPAS